MSTKKQRTTITRNNRRAVSKMKRLARARNLYVIWEKSSKKWHLLQVIKPRGTKKTEKVPLIYLEVITSGTSRKIIKFLS